VRTFGAINLAARRDEAELIEALLEGVFETPLWTTFLDRLRQATGAEHAILNFRPPGRPFEEAMHLLSGATPQADVHELYRKYYYPGDPPPRRMLREGRPYSLHEMLGPDGGSDADFYRELVVMRGVTAIRQMRVEEATGVNAWLTISRRGEDFTARDSGLLSAIAPVLRGVLRQYVAMERERFAASLTAEAVRRLQFGWLMLDRGGHVLDCDEQGALVLSQSGVLSRSATGRIAARPANLEREIFQAIGRVVDDPQGRPRAITLNRDPWLDMLLTPARGKFVSARATPAVIAYVHGDSWRSTDRCDQLAELFALTPGQSRLALALSRGMTIAEAAVEFELTVESARTYSKIIYAKTGARGLPDLVRIVMRSVLAIAPET
jgi:DNA-binding CsgD family transcriptional regulator